jgi:hypothetical protein
MDGLTYYFAGAFASALTLMAGAAEDGERTRLDMVTQITSYTEADRLNYAAWPSVIRLDDGSLLLAYALCTQHYAPNEGRTKILKSFDDGATWSEISEIAVDGYDCLGNNLLQDSAGAVWINHRERKGRATTGFYLRRSTDGGVTWGAKIDLNIKPGDNQSPPEAQIIAPGLTAVIWAYDRQKGDCRMALSRDYGATVERTVQVLDRRIARKGIYPSFCALGDGTFLAVFYFDAGATGPSNIYAVRFNLATRVPL